MKRVIAIAVTLIMTSAPVAFAQTSSTVSLAEVARKEEARRKTTKKATRVITNASLSTVDDAAAVASPPSTGTASKDTSPTNASPTIPGGRGGPVDPAEKKDQAYWQGRIGNARLELSRTQMFAESLQTRINSLKTDFVNRDNRVEREKIQQDLNSALAELERLKTEVEKQKKGIVAIEEEARRAGVPAGWLRPQE